MTRKSIEEVISNIWGEETVVFEIPDKIQSVKIPVTKPFLPPLNEFVELLEEIWESKQLTNIGQYHKDFEQALSEYLGVKYVSLFSNGTLALLTALQALRITGEVITTPFSFVATTHALHWNGITPVFCDITSDTMNLDADKIEALITPKTTAILPVHIYGNPCDTEKIKWIADVYGLKVIYDAAHAFGVEVNGNSILNFGDLSILSFHATKVFTTFEGGAIICRDAATKRRIDFLKNFGFANEVTVVGPGINGKMNEVQAAMGLLQLKYVEDAIKKRQRIAYLYRELLDDIYGIEVLYDIEDVKHNYPYFPILINRNEYGKSRDCVYKELREHNIYARRYFYPLIGQFPTYKGLSSAANGKLPIAEKITKQILCLPIYPDLELEVVYRIAGYLTAWCN